MKLLPNNSSKITFYVITAVLLIGVVLIFFAKEYQSGVIVVCLALAVMLFLFVMNQFNRPGR